MANKFHTEAAQQAADEILRAFQDPDSLPEKLGNVVLHSGGAHSARYSFGNQFLVFIRGYSDAAGYKQWLKYGRQVRKGEKAFPILAPVKRTFTDRDDEGNETKRSFIAGWKDVKVFGLEQTDIVDEEKWEKFQGLDAEARETVAKVESSPFAEVAHSWGLAWTANGRLIDIGAAGCYTHGKGIELAVANLSTAAHELVHAADDKLGTITKRYGQQPDNELVAELGGAICLWAMGLKADADLGGCWEYISGYEKGDTLAAANKLLNRTLAAVAAILACLDGDAPPWAAEEAA